MLNLKINFIKKKEKNKENENKHFMSPSAGTCLLLYDVKALPSCIPDRKCCKTVGAEIKQINA